MSGLIRLALHPLASIAWRHQCRETLNRQGALVLHQFLLPTALKAITAESKILSHLAFQPIKTHNVYLIEPDEAFPADHPRNRLVLSSDSWIADDVIPGDSLLRHLYNDDLFKSFLSDVLGEEALYPYSDPLSPINIHYASAGQELGWHFDNSSFSITLLLQESLGGGVFQYVKDLRDSDAGEMNYEGVVSVLERRCPYESLKIRAGDLVLFRGRNSLHRVTPTEGDVTRILARLAYNPRPGIALSESARMTFYGRI
ncbi:unnamed protein product [Bemisia tabaci]|uniref:Fe2OG dioxygenase domain-containing protein n=1 Tax=Bemisia tabaci TaxID=7038 RepID=A0A9P0A868_BEMTA|nr:unnamed protein product [Bemisia tabaci]